MWSNDNQPPPPKSNGKFSCLQLLGLALIVAMIVAMLLQNLDTQWPIP